MNDTTAFNLLSAQVQVLTHVLRGLLASVPREPAPEVARCISSEVQALMESQHWPSNSDIDRLASALLHAMLEALGQAPSPPR